MVQNTLENYNTVTIYSLQRFDQHSQFAFSDAQQCSKFRFFDQNKLIPAGCSVYKSESAVNKLNPDNRLNPEKLHVNYMLGVGPTDPTSPRRYTLTHSDTTAELFLTIGPDYNESQISGWYTRLMRDEVLAEWKDTDEGPALHVYCHVSGGVVFGPAQLRYQIFRNELPVVLEAKRYGDNSFFVAHPQLDNAPVWVHFESTVPRYNGTEKWGVPADYRQRLSESFF